MCVVRSTLHCRDSMCHYKSILKLLNLHGFAQTVVESGAGIQGESRCFCASLLSSYLASVICDAAADCEILL